MALIEINRNQREVIEKLTQDIRGYDHALETMQEKISELEFALDDQDWTKLGGEDETEFSRDGLKHINRLARLYWLKNPMVKRAVYTQTSYVFGQGVNMEAEHEKVNEVIQDFIEDKKNQSELTEHQARMTKETELQLFSNIFFVFFVNRANGRVRVRTLPVNEVTDVISDPQDKKTPWYYRRDYVEREFLPKYGIYRNKKKTKYYPDWNLKQPRARINGIPVETTPVYHVAVNKLSDQKFGTSEIYAAMDWAKAYKEFLEDWATIVKAHSRFAWRIVVKGQGKSGVKKAKDKLNSTLGTGTPGRETNPAVPAGSTYISSGEKLEPIKTSGAQAKAEDGDRMIHMISAATGIFYHYLVGDPSTGNLATAKSMERPMELMFKDRQTLWASVFERILAFVVHQSVKAPKGKLKSYADIALDSWGDEYIKWRIDKDNPDDEKRRKPIDGSIYVTFPELLEKDMKNQIDSVVSAATMGGKKNAGFITDKEVSRLILYALGVDNVDDKLNKMYPDDEWQQKEEPPDQNNQEPPMMQPNPQDGQQQNQQSQQGQQSNEPQPEDQQNEADIVFRNAVRQMKESLEKWIEHANQQ